MVAALERRVAPRFRPASPDLATVRIRVGFEALVLDCSSVGLAVVTGVRLQPGRPCVVCWPRVEGRPAIAGCVVRCVVGEITSVDGIKYLAAVRLDQPATFLREAATRRE